jgi:signal transduction histidine kinase
MSDQSRVAHWRVRPLERALFARQFLVTALPAACYLLRFRSDSVRMLLILAVAATVLNFIYYALLIRHRFSTACRWARLVLDICLWTALLHYTGGPSSFFYVGYLAEILLSAVALSAVGCLAASALSILGFLILLASRPGMLSWEQDLSRLFGLLLVGFICWFLVRRLEFRSRRIELLNRELAARAATIRLEADELRDRLARAQEAGHAGESAAQALHELRNTVHGLSGFLALLKDDLPRDGRARSLVSLMESGLKEMHRAAEEVASLSCDAARERASLDVRHLVEEAIAFATQGRETDSVAIAVHEDGPVPLTLANREALRGAFVNLIRNALQAMPGGGRLDIRCRAEGSQWVRVEFADTGPGIPASVRERLFEPFVSARPGGMGLGLAISRRVVEAGGGTLTSGPQTGGGTTMIVRLPVHLPDGAIETPSLPAWQDSLPHPSARS